MIKIKTTATPISLPNRYNNAKKTEPPIILPAKESTSGKGSLVTDSAPIVTGVPSAQPATKATNVSAVQSGSNAQQTLPTSVRDFVNDKVMGLLSNAYQKTVSGNPTQQPTKPVAENENDINPFLADKWERIKSLFPELSTQTKGTPSSTKTKQPTVGRTNVSTGSSTVRPSGVLFPVGNEQPPSDTTGIPSEYADLAKVVASLPDGFDLTGWDDKTTGEQRSAMQRSGISGQAQMQLLNAPTSIETIALVQDIQRNRLAYGLSAAEVNKIAEDLFKITNTRIGVKNHEFAYTGNPRSTKLLLQILDEREAELIGPYMNSKGTVYVPTTTDRNKGDTRYTPSKGQYVGYNTIDLTDDLYSFMQDNAVELTVLRDTARHSKTNFLPEFIRNVKTGGPLDIKNKDEWKFRNGITYLFNGIELRNDDPGNIAFGYYSAAIYGKEFLQFGGGLYQLRSDIKNKEKIQWEGKYFDNPRDSAMIEYGYNLYMEDHPK